MNTSQQAIPSIPSAIGALGSRPYLFVDFADGDILLVDRTRAQAEALVARLGSSSRLALRIAGADPLAEALARPPKLVLLATDASGEVPQFLQQLRWHSPIRHIPVIAIADNHEAAVRIRREQLDVQGVVARSARLEQMASQVGAVQLAGAMQPKDVDLSVLAQEIVDELTARNPHRDVLVHVAPDLRAHGDSMLLRIALQNLLANAWKFTGRRRRASVCFRAERRADGTVVYQVRDNGAGFDPSQRPRLFGNFQRLHGEDEFPGTGIGLASVHRIISRHGGQVWAEGAVNEGATFYFTVRNARAGAAEVSPDGQVMAR